MLKKKRVAVIGCGAVAYRWYFNGLMSSNYCEISHLVDNNQENLKKASLYCNVNQCFDSVDLFIEKAKEVDIVLVLTPHKTHYSIIKKLLENNFNVYSEKPFAENSMEAKELIELSKQKHLVFCSAPQVMLSSRNKKTKDIIESGAIGDIVMVRASGSNMGPADRKDTNYDPEWFYNDGGSLSSLGIYTLAIVIYLFGLPNRVAAFSGISIPHRVVKYGPVAGKSFEVTAPDNEIAILDYSKNYVLFDGSYVIKNPCKHELIIHGTKGTLYVGGFGGPESIVIEDESGRREIGPNDDCHILWNLSWGVDEMAKSMNSNQKAPTDASFSYNVIRVIEAIRQSSKNNSMILF